MQRALSIIALAISMGMGRADEPTVAYRSKLAAAVDPKVWSNTRTTAAPVGGEVLLGEFHSHESVVLTVGDLPPHRFLRLRAKLHIIRTPDGSLGKPGIDYWSVEVRGRGSLMFTTFHNDGPPVRGAVQAWPDEFPDGRHPPATGASARNALGFEIPFKQGRVCDSTYDLAMSFPHAGESVQLDFSSAFGDPPNEESWALSEIVIEALPAPEKLDEAGLAALWQALIGDDAVAAHAAVWSLVEQGDNGVAYAKAQNESAAEAKRERFGELLMALAAEGFAVRQRALTELRRDAFAYRLLATEWLEREGLAPEVKATLKRLVAARQLGLIESRYARLMRVSAFEPGAARAVLDARRLAVNSKRAPAGGYVLKVSQAEIGSPGRMPRFRISREFLECLLDPGITLDWEIAKPEPGKYSVQVEYACDAANAGSLIELKVGAMALPYRVQSSGGWLEFKTFDLGEVEIGEGTERLELALLAKTRKAHAFFNPKSLKLVPTG